MNGLSKRILAIVLTFCMLICAVPFATRTTAATEYNEGIYTYTVSDSNATITDCDSSASGAVTIPSTLGGYPVTSIGNEAFEGCSRLTSIEIPDSVTTIGDYAFHCCIRLQSITIPSSVTNIGSRAFCNCTGLTKISVSEENTNYSSQDGILFNKDKTKLIQYPIGNTRKSYTIPNTVASIGISAFAFCTTLTSVTIPDSVISIGVCAFDTCESIANVIIPDSVIKIGGAAFYRCTSLTNLAIPDNVTSIESKTFAFCTKLKSITIPDSVTKICDLAFYKCVSLASINIPDSITSIGDRAFEDCEDMNSITISDSVTCIGSGAFEYCDSLTDVYYRGTEDDWKKITIKQNNECLTSATIHYLGNGTENDSDDKISNGTYSGTLESSSLVVVLYSDQPSYYNVMIDGTEYSLLPGMDNPDKYIDKNVVFTVEDNRVTWIQSVDEIKFGLSCKVYATEIDQKGNNYNTDKIQVTFKISNTLRDFYGDIDVLSEIPELDLNVKTIYVGTNDAEALNFGKDGLFGDEITTLTFDIDKNIGIGKTEIITIDLPFKVNELDSSEKSKNVFLNYTVDLVQKLTPKQLRDNVKVVINNLNYSGTVVPPSDDSDISAEASDAADALENLTTAVSIGAHPSLNAITNNEQRTEMAQSLLTVVAVAQTPKAVLEKYLTEKVINKILKINVNTLTVRTGEVSCTYVVDNETYGEIKIKLTCEYNAYNFMESNFSGNGKISYEIVGGRGAKKLPENMQKSGYCGDLYFANVRAFFEKASSVVESALKNAYDKVYGDNLNKAADIIFGKVVTHIMKRTDYKSVSGLTWKLITTPIKEINVKCPVDVYVYNSENVLVAAVENNEVILQGDENAEISVDGDVKNIILYDGSYTIEYFSTAESEMEIVVSEYGNSEQLLRTATKSNIPLKIGLNYSQNVDDQILEDSDYSLTSNNGEIYSPDSDIIDLHEHISNGQWFIESEPSCSQNGKNYSICSKCNKTFYGETSPATGHDYVVSAWTWNGFKSAETKFVCVNDESHFEIIKADITSETINPTCNSDGETVYTAYVNFNGKTYTDTKVDVLTASGHSFGEWLITKNATIYADGKMERICSECNAKEERNYSKDAVELSIRIPTQTVIKYGDSIILHADTVLPTGAKVIWKTDNDNFKYYVSSDGKECTITPDMSGDTTFTAYVVDANGEVISEEYTQTMTSKAGFFQKIIAFFKKLFRLTKTYPEVYKLIK